MFISLMILNHIIYMYCHFNMPENFGGVSSPSKGHKPQALVSGKKNIPRYYIYQKNIPRWYI
jgi:hypothetical protein